MPNGLNIWIAPKYSRSRVDQAGKRLRSLTQSDGDQAVVENWRVSHAYVLNAFQVVLRRRIKEFDGATFAQRHKRRSTIEDKLTRHPNMALSKMHDIAGCRLIFKDMGDLSRFRSAIFQSRWAHVRTNDAEDFDYVKSPKRDGYRGIHDVYQYRSRSASANAWDGLRIEIQYRTVVQHSWATAVEISDSLMDVGAKFGRAPGEHMEFFSNVSKLFEMVVEKTRPLDEEVVSRLRQEILSLEAKTNIIARLQGLSASGTQVRDYKHIILEIDKISRKLHVYQMKSLKSATQQLLNLEINMNQSKDIVLVSADSSLGLRSAFRNYFSDAGEFLKYYRIGMKQGP